LILLFDKLPKKSGGLQTELNEEALQLGNRDKKAIWSKPISPCKRATMSCKEGR